MSRTPSRILGIDLGGTRIKMGLVDPQGRILFSKNDLTRVDLGLDRGLGRICRIIKKFIAASLKKGGAPELIGLGAPGAIDREKGIVHYSPNFPDWREVPLSRMIAEETGLPTFLDNDANVVASGEQWVGAGKDWSHFLCLTLGTGVGSGLILNGRPWNGCYFSGPEFGHMTIHPRGERCGCGNRGCLETLASATYLVKKAQKGLDHKVPTLLSKMLPREAGGLTARLLYEAARQGDPFCHSLYAKMGKSLGLALANIVHMLGIEGVILGGGVSRAANIFLPYLEKEFKRRLTMAPADKFSIRVSFLEEKSGILGAARMAMERYK